MVQNSDDDGGTQRPRGGPKFRRRRRLIDQPLVDQRLVDQRLVDQRLVDQRLVDQRLVDQRLVDLRLVRNVRGPTCNQTGGEQRWSKISTTTGWPTTWDICGFTIWRPAFCPCSQTISWKDTTGQMGYEWETRD